MATVPRPGIGPTIRTEADLSASPRSSARLTTWLTLMPGAGSNSYDVMMAPELGGRGRLEEPYRGELERLGSARAEVEGLLPREPLLGQAPARGPGLDDDGRRHDLGQRLGDRRGRRDTGHSRRRRRARGHGCASQ